MGRRALLLNFAFWTLFGALTASNWLLSPVIHQYPDPGPLVAKALFNSYVWALLTPAIFWLATVGYTRNLVIKDRRAVGDGTVSLAKRSTVLTAKDVNG